MVKIAQSLKWRSTGVPALAIDQLDPTALHLTGTMHMLKAIACHPHLPDGVRIGPTRMHGIADMQRLLCSEPGMARRGPRASGTSGVP
jgi:hypothetical protein